MRRCASVGGITRGASLRSPRFPVLVRVAATMRVAWELLDVYARSATRPSIMSRSLGRLVGGDSEISQWGVPDKEEVPSQVYAERSLVSKFTSRAPKYFYFITRGRFVCSPGRREISSESAISSSSPPVPVSLYHALNETSNKE